MLKKMLPSMGFVIALFPAIAMAKSSTMTSLSVIGDVRPGASVIVRATVTGNHIISGPYPTYPGAPNYFFGGGVSISANGVVVKSDAAGLWNSSASCQPLLFTPPFDTICHGSITVIDVSYVIPRGLSNTRFEATFSGDHDSQSSSASPLTIKAVPKTITPAVDVLFD